MQSQPPFCASCFWSEERDANKQFQLKLITTFTLRCVQGPVGEHISDNLMQPTTESSLARARVFEIAPKGLFNLSHNGVKHCTDRDSFVGQGFDGKNLGGAHMTGGVVPKRAMQASITVRILASL